MESIEDELKAGRFLYWDGLFASHLSDEDNLDYLLERATRRIIPYRLYVTIGRGLAGVRYPVDIMREEMR